MVRGEAWSLESLASTLPIAFLPNNGKNNPSKTPISGASWFFEDPLSKINTLKFQAVRASDEVRAG